MKVTALTSRFLLVVSLAFFTVYLSAAETPSPRERLLLDFGWKFHLGNEWGFAQNLSKAGTGSGPASMSFSDASWRAVNLPHDWAVELPFDSTADAGHGFKPVGPGFPQTSVAWYRRTFDLPETDAGKRLWLEFDGVFRDCDVFVNGWFVGHHDSGYDSFRYDITDVANYGGKNIVAVKVDASQFEGWFYEGAGIYRHVWLVKTAPVAIAPDGIFVYTKFKHNVPSDKAPIEIKTTVINLKTNSVAPMVSYTIYGPDGKIATGISFTRNPIPKDSQCTFDKTINIGNPVFWSPESPKLYKLVTRVLIDNPDVHIIHPRSILLLDQEETEFGIRTVAFDPNSFSSPRAFPERNTMFCASCAARARLRPGLPRNRRPAHLARPRHYAPARPHGVARLDRARARGKRPARREDAHHGGRACEFLPTSMSPSGNCTAGNCATFPQDSSGNCDALLERAHAARNAPDCAGIIFMRPDLFAALDPTDYIKEKRHEHSSDRNISEHQTNRVAD